MRQRRSAGDGASRGARARCPCCLPASLRCGHEVVAPVTRRGSIGAHG